MSSPPTPKVAVTQIERPVATTTGNDGRARQVVPMISMAAGALVIVGALAFLLVDRGPEIDIPDFSQAFACPPGVESRSGRMQVTANELNVRAAPSARGDGWSRVRLVDGRWGWVATQYLASVSLTN